MLDPDLIIRSAVYPTGTPGKEVELQANETHIQWKYDTSEEWTDLVLLEDLQGDVGPSAPIDTDSTLAANSDLVVASQKAVKTYVDAEAARATAAEDGLTSAVASKVTFNGALGTPISGIATNLSGTASGLTAGTVTTNANLTGVVTSVGNATSIADAALSIAKTSGLQSSLDDINTVANAHPFILNRVPLTANRGIMPLGLLRFDMYVAQNWGSDNVPAKAWPFQTTQPFQKISIRHTAGTHPDAIIEIGIYTSGADGRPHTLIEKGSVTLTAPGIKTVTLAAPVTINGLFFVLVRPDRGTITWAATGGTGSLETLGINGPSNPLAGQITGSVDPTDFDAYHGWVVDSYAATALLPAVMNPLDLYPQQLSNGAQGCIPIIHN